MGWKVGRGAPPEEIKQKMRESAKTRPQHKAGRYCDYQIDSKVFMETYKVWAEGLINTKEFRRRCGITTKKSFDKRLVMLLEDEAHEIPGRFFTDGKPIYASFEGLKPGLLIKPKLTRRKPNNPKGCYIKVT